MNTQAMSSKTDGATKPQSLIQQIADLAIANHILYDQGVVDAFGHVSVRHTQYPDRFLLARNMAPGLVTAEDIIEFDLEGKPLNDAGRKVGNTLAIKGLRSRRAKCHSGCHEE